MAKEKTMHINYKNDNLPLDANQNRFVNAILGGSLPGDALMEGYPHTKKLTSVERSKRGNKLKKVPKIAKEIEARCARIKQASEIEAKWERTDSIATLKNVIARNVKELNRIDEAFEKEAATLLACMDSAKTDDEKANLLAAFIKQQKTRRISKIHNSAIIESVSELNKMQGYNLTNFEISGDAVVRFEGEDEILD